MKKAIVTLVLIAVIGVIGWQAWQRYQAKQQANNGQKPRGGGGAVAVEVTASSRRTLVDARVFAGTLEPNSQFVVAPKVSGRLATLAVDLGDAVKPGEPIATLDADEYEQDVKQAQAELAVARANAEEVRLQAGLDREIWQQQVAQAEADLAMARASIEDSKSALEAARRDYERVKALREKQIAPEAELDAAHDRFLAEQAQMKVQEADLARKAAALKAAQVRLSSAQDQAQDARVAHAQAQVTQREAAVRAAEIRLAYTRIVADWSTTEGERVIGERHVDVGVQLKANDPIVSVLDISRLRAVCTLTEVDYPKVAVGQVATLSTDAYPGRTFTATVARVAPELDVLSRQARVELAVDNADGSLRPGMFVRVRLEFGRHPDVVAVPIEALARRQERQGVFVVDAKATVARFVPIEAGLTDGGWVEIRSPELRGEVVTLGQHLLTDGAKVMLPRQAEGKPGAKPANAGPSTP